MDNKKFFTAKLLLLLPTVFLFLFSKNEIPAVLADQEAGELVINEIMYDPEGSDDKKEWLELKNLSSQEIALAGFKLNDGSNHLLNIPPKNGGQGELKLIPGGFLIIADNAQQFLQDYPEVTCPVIDSSFSLKNSTSTIALLNSNKEIVASKNYSSEEGGDGNGTSLERKEKDGQILWQSSVGLGGTPGRQNSPFSENQEETEDEPETIEEEQSGESEEETPQPEQEVNTLPLEADAGPDITALVGQEIVFNAADSSGDLKYFFWNFGDGEACTNKQEVAHRYDFPGIYIVSLTVGDGQNEKTDTCEVTIYQEPFVISEFLPWAEEADKDNEWIEVYNQNQSIQSLAGWQLDDEEKGSRPFVFPKNTFIKGQGFLVVSRKITKIALNNDGDKVRLLFPNGQLAQEVVYDQAQKNFSGVLDSDNSFYWTDAPTPGKENFAGQNRQLNSNQKPLSFLQPNSQKVSVPKSSVLDFVNLIPAALASQVKGVKTFAESQANFTFSKNQPDSNSSQQNPSASKDLKKDKNSLPELSQIKFPTAFIVLIFSLILGLGILGYWIVSLLKR